MARAALGWPAKPNGALPDVIQYHSNSSFPTPGLQQPAFDMANAQSPYTGKNHRDVFAGLRKSAAVDLSRYGQQKQDEYEQEAGRAERELALAGLTMMGQAQNNEQNLENSRLQLLLRGLL